MQISTLFVITGNLVVLFDEKIWILRIPNFEKTRDLLAELFLQVPSKISSFAKLKIYKLEILLLFDKNTWILQISSFRNLEFFQSFDSP